MITEREQHAAMGSCLIDEHADHLRSAGCSDKTIEARCRLLRRVHDTLDLGLAYASTRELEQFLARGQRRGWGRATLRNYDMHIRGFFRWADGAGILDGDPTLRMKRPKPARFRPKPATREQVELALAAPYPWGLACALAYLQGMRASEIAACCREHVTQDVTFIPRGKGGDRNCVPTHAFVWALVRDMPVGPLFAEGERGGRVDGHYISQGVRRMFSDRGQHCSAHRLRHSFATDMLNGGATIRAVQLALRHASMATSAAYLEATDEQVRAAVAMLRVPTIQVGTPAGSKPAGVARGRPGEFGQGT